MPGGTHRELRASLWEMKAEVSDLKAEMRIVEASLQRRSGVLGVAEEERRGTGSTAAAAAARGDDLLRATEGRVDECQEIAARLVMLVEETKELARGALEKLEDNTRQLHGIGEKSKATSALASRARRRVRRYQIGREVNKVTVAATGALTTVAATGAVVVAAVPAVAAAGGVTALATAAAASTCVVL